MKQLKLSALVCAAAMGLAALTGCTGAASSADSAESKADTQTPASSDVIALSDIADTLGAGWNYGNTMEAVTNEIVSETAWGNPAVSQEMLDAVAEAGFKTVRMPVSYIGKIDDANGYTVDAAWLDRIEEVVGYCYNSGLNVIINVHGDGYNSIPGGWLLVNGDDQDTIEAKYKALWTQISDKFKAYDEHLIFESMNEVFDGEYHDPPKEYYENLNSYNQIFVDTVRASGGENTHRWLLVPGWNTDITYTVGDYGFAMPEDKNNSAGEGRLLLSVHYYNPWDYCGDENFRVYTWGDKGQELIDQGAASKKNMANYGDQKQLEELFGKLKSQFVDNGIPVIIGEYGCIDKTGASAENAGLIAENRAYFNGYVAGTAASMGIIPVYWDNGYNGKFGFGLFDRNKIEQTQPEIIKAIVTAVAEKNPKAGSAASVNIEVEKPSELHAYIGVQSHVYTFRNAASDATYGLDSGYFDTLIKWEDTDGDGNSDITDAGASFSDATIAADGTYTVSVSGYDFSAEENPGLNMLFVSTDIPYSGMMRVADVTMTVDGQEIALDKPIISTDNDGNLYIEIVNIYNDMAPNPEIAVPTDSISISFTLGNVKSALAS